jgi:DNA-binding CsgD family transcriptional regulator
MALPDREKALLYFMRVGLTEMQSRVAVELVFSNSDEEIAERLNRANSTVHTHRLKIYKFFGVRNRGDFIAYCLSNGLL